MKKRILALMILCLMLSILTSALAVGAVLNQKMATRSGPGTEYTEELGSFPRDTAITLIEYTQDENAIPWGLVEFSRHNMLYRAYTGMKRINVMGSAPYKENNSVPASITGNTTVYYGPGTHYAARKEKLSAGMPILVCGEENGFVQIEYELSGRPRRGYVPAGRTNYTLSSPSMPEPSMPGITGGIHMLQVTGSNSLYMQWASVPGASVYQISFLPGGGTPSWICRTGGTMIHTPSLPSKVPCTVQILALSETGYDEWSVINFAQFQHTAP